MRSVGTALDTVGEAAESQGHVDLPYCRSRARCDRYGSDRDDYRLVDARAREVATVLESRIDGCVYRLFDERSQTSHGETAEARDVPPFE